MSNPSSVLTSKILNATVVVTALGYAIDLYDLFIFNVTRTPSLTELGLSSDNLTSTGLFISNCQLFGLLIGSYLWGVLGDKFGRKSCLFASILTYSLASLYCSIVPTVNLYAAARFVAGLGVAGELGMGLTLISEKLAAHRRGYGTAFFIIIGFSGVLLAALAAETLSWRTAYLVGGIAGLFLLIARAFVLESGLYQEMAHRSVKRGQIKTILRSPRLLKKYIASILLIAPATFTPQILWTLSPELAKAQGLTAPVKASMTLFIGYSCVMFGDLFASLLSEKLGSRKKAIIVFYCLGFIFFLKYLLMPSDNLVEFYVTNGLLGLVFGIWVVMSSLITEQIGTNIRSTFSTTVPNLARALAIPMNLLFAYFKPLHGAMTAVEIIGILVFSVALWGWFNVDETYGKDLNYEEK